MVEFRHVGTFTDGADKILTNISDLSLMVSDGQAFLLTASHAGGALAGFRLGDAEALPVFQRAIFYPSTALHLHSPVISNLELPGGDIALLSGLRLGAPLAARVTEGADGRSDGFHAGRAGAWDIFRGKFFDRRWRFHAGRADGASGL